MVVFGQVFLVWNLYNKHLHHQYLKVGAVMQRMKFKLVGKDSSVEISKLKGGGGRHFFLKLYISGVFLLKRGGNLQFT